MVDDSASSPAKHRNRASVWIDRQRHGAACSAGPVIIPPRTLLSKKPTPGKAPGEAAPACTVPENTEDKFIRALIARLSSRLPIRSRASLNATENDPLVIQVSKFLFDCALVKPDEVVAQLTALVGQLVRIWRVGNMASPDAGLSLLVVLRILGNVLCVIWNNHGQCNTGKGGPPRRPMREEEEDETLTQSPYSGALSLRVAHGMADSTREKLHVSGAAGSKRQVPLEDGPGIGKQASPALSAAIKPSPGNSPPAPMRFATRVSSRNISGANGAPSPAKAPDGHRGASPAVSATPTLATESLDSSGSQVSLSNEHDFSDIFSGLEQDGSADALRLDFPNTFPMPPSLGERGSSRPRKASSLWVPRDTSWRDPNSPIIQDPASANPFADGAVRGMYSSLSRRYPSTDISCSAFQETTLSADRELFPRSVRKEASCQTKISPGSSLPDPPKLELSVVRQLMSLLTRHLLSCIDDRHSKPGSLSPSTDHQAPNAYANIIAKTGNTLNRIRRRSSDAREGAFGFTWTSAGGKTLPRRRSSSMSQNLVSSEPLTTMQEIRSEAGRILRYISASNWSVILSRYKLTLIQLKSLGMRDDSKQGSATPVTSKHPRISISVPPVVVGGSRDTGPGDRVAGKATPECPSDRSFHSPTDLYSPLGRGVPGELPVVLDSKPDRVEFRLISWCSFNRQRLSELLTVCAAYFRGMKTSWQIALGQLLYNAIWDWIEFFPREFVQLTSMSRDPQSRADSPEKLLETVLDVLESDKKPQSVARRLWPLMTMLVILSPNKLQRVLDDPTRKTKIGGFVHRMRKQFKSHHLQDSTLTCLMDICKVSSYSSDKLAPVNRLASDVGREDSSKLLDAANVISNLSASNADIYTQLFAYLIGMNGAATLPMLVTLLVSEAATGMLRFVVLRSLILFLETHKFESHVRRDLLRSCGFASLLASPCRSLLTEYSHRFRLRKAIRSGNASPQQSDCQRDSEILKLLLRLFALESTLSYTLDEHGHAGVDEVTETMTNLVLCLEFSPTWAYKALVENLNVSGMRRWAFGPPSLISAFWRISSKAILLISELSLMSQQNHERAKVYLESLKFLLESRNQLLRDDTRVSLRRAQSIETIAGAVYTEAAILTYISASDKEVSSLAEACLCELIAEIQLTEEHVAAEYCHHSAAPNYHHLLQYLAKVGPEGSISLKRDWDPGSARSLPTLKNASDEQEERLKKVFLAEGAKPCQVPSPEVILFLQSVPHPTMGVIKLWEQGYKRWRSLKESLSHRSTAELTDAETRKWAFESVLLISLAGTMAKEIPIHSINIEKNIRVHGRALEVSSLPSPGVRPVVDAFIREMVELLGAEKSGIRRVVLFAISCAMPPNLSLRFLHAVQTGLTEILNQKRLTSNASIFAEQVAVTTRNIFEMCGEASTEACDMTEFGNVLTLLIKFLQTGGADPVDGSLPSFLDASGTLKRRLCELIETFISKDPVTGLGQDVKFRNTLLERLVEWATGYGEMQSVDASMSIRQNRLKRQITLACMKAIVPVTENLPLMVSTPENHVDMAEAKSRLCFKYFSYFANVLDFSRRLGEDERDKNQAHDAEARQDLAQIRDCAIAGLSNMLRANVGIGLRYSLSMAYHDDHGAREVFVRVLANITRQGMELNQLNDAERAPERKQELLLDLLLEEEDLLTVIALCDVTPLAEVHGLVDLLLGVFHTPDLLLRLVRALVKEEVLKSDSATTMFRRNTVATKVLTHCAKQFGAGYLQTFITPVVGRYITEDVSVELDAKELTGDAQRVVNSRNLRRVCQALLDSIFSSSDAFPSLLKDICCILAQVVSMRYPQGVANAVAGFVFLRFICPSIINVDAYEVPVSSRPKVQRALVLVAKVIQNLANGTVLTFKESYMEEMNPFLKENEMGVPRFIETISGGPMTATKQAQKSEQDSPKPPVLRALHKLVYENQTKLMHQIALSEQRVVNRNTLLLSGQANAAIASKSSAEPAHSSKPTQSALPKSTGPPARNSEVRGDSMAQPSSRSEGDSSFRPKDCVRIKRRQDTLLSVLVNLGPPPESLKRDAKFNKTFRFGTTNKLFAEFMRRNQGRSIEELRALRFFYDAGVTRFANPVFYYVARRLVTNSVDMELVLYCILRLMKAAFQSSYDLIIDATQFRSSNEIPQQWLFQFFHILPLEARANINSIWVFNCNSSFKRYIASFPRDWASDFISRTRFVSTQAELRNHIDLEQLKLPRTTVSLESDTVTYSPVNRIYGYGNTIPVVLRINPETIQVTSVRKQSIASGQAILNDVYHISEIESVVTLASRGDATDFMIQCENGAAGITLSSPKFDGIEQAIRTAKLQFQMTKKAILSERTIRPDDVPGTLMNVSLHNLGSAHAGLRTASHDLLATICVRFHFQASSLHSGASVTPLTGGRYLLGLSSQLSKSAKHLTLEFLEEWCEGFECCKDTQHKAYCIQYLLPWLSNLPGYLGGSGSKTTRSRIVAIIRKWFEFTVRDQPLWSTMQEKLWRFLGRLDEISKVCLEVLVTVSCDKGIYSNHAAASCATVVSLEVPESSLMGMRVSRKLRALLATAPVVAASSSADARHAVSKTLTYENGAFVNHPRHDEVVMLTRMLSALTFEGQCFIDHCLADVVYIISALAGRGNQDLRLTVYGIIVNIASLRGMEHCRLSVVVTDERRDLCQQLMAYLGINQASRAPFSGSRGSCETQTDMQLSDYEKIVRALDRLIDLGVRNPDDLARVRSRWVSLTAQAAFQRNCVVQPRALVALGVVAEEELGDDTYDQAFKFLGEVVTSKDEVSKQTIVGVMAFFANTLRTQPAGFHLLRHVFWVSVMACQIHDATVFCSAANLIDVALRIMDANGLFLEAGLSESLLGRKRFDATDRILREFQLASGVDFDVSMSFGLSALLLRGMKRQNTREASEQVFRTLVNIGMQVVASSDMSAVECDLAGYFCVLWTANESVRDEVRLMLSTFDPEDLGHHTKHVGAKSEVPDHEGQRDHQTKALLGPKGTFLRKLLDFQGFCSSNSGVLTLATFLVVLQTKTLMEDQVIEIYKCFLEAAEVLPGAFISASESLLQISTQLIAETRSEELASLLHSVYQCVAHAHIERDESGKPRKSLASWLESMGFHALIRDGNVSMSGKRRRIGELLQQYICAVVSAQHDAS